MTATTTKGIVLRMMLLGLLSEKKYKMHILGLGKPSEKNNNLNYYLIPYFNFNRYGFITCYSPILGFILMLPLYFSAIILSIFNNPKTINN